MWVYRREIHTESQHVFVCTGEKYTQNDSQHEINGEKLKAISEKLGKRQSWPLSPNPGSYTHMTLPTNSLV